MQKSLEDIKGIGKTTLKRLEKSGIDSIDKLATMSVEDLEKIQGIGKSSAQKYVKLAKEFMQKIRGEPIKPISKKGSISQERKPLQKVQIKPLKIQPINVRSINNKTNPRNQNINSQNKKIDANQNIKNSKIQKQRNPNVSQQNRKKQKNQFKKKKSPSNKKHEEQPRKPQLQTFFPQEVIYRIRFLHYRIKELETLILKESDHVDLENLNYILEYVKLLNINYKTQSQIKIIKELDLTPIFHDPIDNKEIQIWDIMYECARALWILARTYALFSRKYEEDRRSKDAVTAMFESSRIFKAAAHFSVACTRQEEIGTTLSFENLELKSEEARIIAQSIVAEREERIGNYFLASKLYSGLSALSKRLYYSKELPPIKESMLQAQFTYDLGKAYFLKAKASSISSMSFDSEENNRKLKQKSNYYFSKAEEIWHYSKEKFKTLTDDEIRNVDYNLSIVNDYIIENDEETMDREELKKIPDIEPLIAIPENISHIIPKTIHFLTKYPPKNIEFKKYKQFKDLKLEKNYLQNEKQKLTFKRASINRTIKQLKSLYNNNDIGINKFAELIEKYMEKLEVINDAIERLELRKSELEKTNKPKKKIPVEIQT